MERSVHDRMNELQAKHWRFAALIERHGLRQEFLLPSGQSFVAAREKGR